jgi:hypothetical protein
MGKEDRFVYAILVLVGGTVLAIFGYLCMGK